MADYARETSDMRPNNDQAKTDRISIIKPKVRSACNESGFALLVVIWLAGLLGLLFLTFLSGAGVHTRMITNSVENTKAAALADAGIMLGILELMHAEQRNNADVGYKINRSRACQLPNLSTLVLTISDAAGRVDLNIGRPELFRALLIGLGVSRNEADRFVAVLQDFRDPDDQRQLNGAEAADYRAAGMLHGPKNGPFESIEELGNIIGIKPGLMAKLRPYLTVRSAQEGIDPKAATPTLLSILQSGARPEQYINHYNDLSNDLENKKVRLPKVMLASSARQAYVLRAAVFTQNRARFAREVVVAIRQRRKRRGVARELRQKSLSRRQSPIDRQGNQKDFIIWDWRSVELSSQDYLAHDAFKVARMC